jgi:hypothetical protein
MRKRQQWVYENRELWTDLEFYGRVSERSTVPAEEIAAGMPVKISFDWSLGPIGTARIRANAIGLVGTEDQFEHTGRPLSLSTMIRTTKEGAIEFERTFHRAVSNGLDCVPLWVCGEGKVLVNGDDGRFGVIQPLDRVNFQQHLSLSRKLRQEFLD